MIRSRVPYLTLLMVWIGLLLPTATHAQLGIRWTPPEQSQEAAEQLDLFINSGIPVLEVPAGTSIPALGTDSLQIQFWVRGGQKYLSYPEISERRDVFREQLEKLLNDYGNDPKVAHIGIISQSHTQHRLSLPILQSLLTQAEERGSSDLLYETRVNDLISLSDSSRIAHILDLGSYERRDLLTFRDSLDALLNRNELLMIEADWYLQAVADFPALPGQLKDRLVYDSGFLALPEIPEERSGFDPSVILLFVLWGTIAILITYYPTYRPMLLRYFGAHSFYVDDIIQYRERAAASGVVLLFIHALSGALIYTIGFDHLLSTQAGSAFFHHAPALAVFGDSLASVFAVSLVVILIVELIALGWLFLPNRELPHFSQVINLYSWIFHVDIILATLMVTFAASGASSFWMLAALLLYTLIWFLAFNISAIDASRALSSGKNLYLFLTIGLHSIVSIGLVIMAFVLTEISAVLELVAFLSP